MKKEFFTKTVSIISIEAVLALCLQYIIERKSILLVDPLRLTTWAIVLFLIICLWLLKNRGSSHGFLSVITAGIFVAVLSIPFIKFINVYFDSSELKECLLVVKDKYTSSRISKKLSGGNLSVQSYFIVLDNMSSEACSEYLPRDTYHELIIPVKDSEYREIVPQQTWVKFHVRKGVLGIPWIVPVGKIFSHSL